MATGTTKIENLGPVMSAGADSVRRDAGIRSNPLDGPWNPTANLRSGTNRKRVQISRTLHKELPFVGYLNRWIPEEALDDGLTIASLSKDADFKLRATEYFDLWASSSKIDVQGQVNWYEAQAPLGELVDRDGGVFCYKVKSSDPAALGKPLSDKSFRALQLQFLRRDQIGSIGLGSIGLGSASGSGDTKGLRWDDGIGINDLDRPALFRVLRRKDGSLTPNDYIDVPAGLMMHIKRAHFEGVHGIPAIFPSGESSALDYLDTRALSKYADKIRACFLGAITTPDGEAPAGVRANVRKGKKADPDNPGQTVDDNRRFFDIGGGIFIPILRDGETITFFNGPSTLSYGEQLKMLLTEIAFARGLPPEYVIAPEKLGSAAARMILRKIRKVLNAARRPFMNTYCQQSWEFVIGDAIARGILPNVEDWNVIEVRNAPDPSIDAGRDEATERARLQNFTSTVDKYCDGLGLNGRKIRHERIDEIADNIKYGQLTHNLPWFLCIEPAVLTAIAGIAGVMQIDLAAIGEQLKNSPKVED